MFNNQPTFTAPELPEFKKKSASALFNEAFEDIEYDLTTLYEGSTSLNLNIFDSNSALSSQLDSIASKIDSLELTLTNIETILSTFKKFFHFNAYSTDMVVTPDTEVSKAQVETKYGLVQSEELTSVSKFGYVNNTNGIFTLYPDLVISLDSIISVVDEEYGGTIIETPTDRMVDNDPTTYYERKVLFPASSSVSDVRVKVTVTLPRVSNPNVNQIIIDPYPEFNAEVESIAYSTLSSPFVYTSLNGFETSKKGQKVLVNSVEPYKLRIILKQSSFTYENGFKVFKYGIRNLDARLVSYKDNSSVLLKFEVPTYVTGTINDLTNFTTDPEISDAIRYKIYPSEAAYNNNEAVWDSYIDAPISSNFPLDLSTFLSRELYVRGIFQRLLNTTPYLKTLDINYTT